MSKSTERGIGGNWLGRALSAAILSLIGSIAVLAGTAQPAMACHGLLYGNLVQGPGGFTFEVTSSFASASSITAVANNGTATLSGTSWSTGQPPLIATVTGLTSGQSSTVTFNALLGGGGTACTAFTASAGTDLPAVTPTPATPAPTSDGFTFAITNFDPSRYDYTLSATNGATATVDGAGVVTVTGLAAGQASTVTVTATAKVGSGFTGVATSTQNGSAAASGAGGGLAATGTNAPVLAAVAAALILLGFLMTRLKRRRIITTTDF